ncbi:MAG: Gfo/Idh/MocA family oxidoreductase [Thermomicrobiales bacterium]
MRIAILGAGFMGSTHGRALATLPGVEIAAIYAHSEKRAAPLAAELKTTWTGELDRILRDESIDAIDICLPTPQHRPTAEAAIAAGKHVLLEKPVAMTDADALALVELADRSDRVFMIAHVLRFWPEYVELARLVKSGDYGTPRSGLAFRRQPFPAWSELFSRSDLTGGAVVDQMIHDYDALNWIFGDPQAVTATGLKNARSGGWDQVQVLVDYGDSSALVDGGMMMPESYPFSSTLHVLCETGAMEYEFRAGGRSVEMGAGVNQLKLFPNEGDPTVLTVEQQDPYLAEVAYFCECVASGTSADRATPADARKALQVALAAVQSLETGHTVPIS